MDVRMLTAQEALERLKSGNARFVKGKRPSKNCSLTKSVLKWQVNKILLLSS
jgi:hypothetical protein